MQIFIFSCSLPPKLFTTKMPLITIYQTPPNYVGFATQCRSASWKRAAAGRITSAEEAYAVFGKCAVGDVCEPSHRGHAQQIDQYQTIHPLGQRTPNTNKCVNCGKDLPVGGQYVHDIMDMLSIQAIGCSIEIRRGDVDGLKVPKTIVPEMALNFAVTDRTLTIIKNAKRIILRRAIHTH